MGTAFNYNLLYHEPGAYAHNPDYTKKLIYNSNDYLNGADSVETSLGGFDAACVFVIGTRP
jgi:hypothetical protein